MPDVTVHPHGDRWAVATAGASSPLREFETREAAVTSARQLADGGNVDVLDEDPTTLAGREGDADPAAAVERPRDGMTDHEHLRSEQGGL